MEGLQEQSYDWKQKIRRQLVRWYLGIRFLDDYFKKIKVIKNYKENPRYLDVGGLRRARMHWRTLAYVENSFKRNPVFVDYNVNLEELKNWEIPDEHFDLVYTSHTLEHLSDKAYIKTIKEIYRVMRKGAGLRIVVPDIELAIEHYKKGDLEWFETWYSNFYMREGYEIEEHFIRYFADDLLDKMDLSKVKEDFKRMEKYKFLKKYKSKLDPTNLEKHLQWFNFEKLKKILEEVGFKDINLSECQKSQYTEMCWGEFDVTFPFCSLFMEAKK